MTFLEALVRREPFHHGPYSGHHNTDSGAYEVLQDGRTIALAWPQRDWLINPAFRHADVLERALKEQ